MGIGVSVFLIAIGAILAWGVNYQPQGIELDVIGVILMLVGGAGLLFSLLFWSSFAPFGRNEVVEHELRTREHDHLHRHAS